MNLTFMALFCIFFGLFYILYPIFFNHGNNLRFSLRNDA